MNHSQALEDKVGFLPVFSRDLRRLETFVKDIEKNREVLEGGSGEEKGKLKAELSYLLNLEEKWKDYPEWYLCLRGGIREIKELRGYTWGNFNPGGKEEGEKRKGIRWEERREKGEEESSAFDLGRRNEGESREIERDKKEEIEQEETKKEETRERGIERITGRAFGSQDINQFYENKGIVGEKTTRTLLLYGALGKAHMGLESLSGAGKSALLYAFLEALPKEKVYLLKRATEKALFNDPEVNNYTFLIVTEFQKIPDGLKEDIKDLTEGVDSTYRRTNKSKEGIDKLTVSAGKVVVYTLAITNDYFKKKDNELNRRFIVFPTDISKQQNIAVVEALAKKEFLDKKSYPDEHSFLGHIRNCLNLDYELKNPFLGYLTNNQPEEITGNVRYRSFVKHVQKLVKGCTLFHHKNRVKKGGVIFADLKDNREVMELYGQLFYDNIIGISVVDRLVLDSLELEKTYMEKEVIDKIAAEGFYDKTTVIKDSLENLGDLRFLLKEKGNITKVKDKCEYKEAKWEEAWNFADSLMKEHYGQLRDDWFKGCSQEYNTSLLKTGG